MQKAGGAYTRTTGNSGLFQIGGQLKTLRLSLGAAVITFGKTIAHCVQVDTLPALANRYIYVMKQNQLVLRLEKGREHNLA